MLSITTPGYLDDQNRGCIDWSEGLLAYGAQHMVCIVQPSTPPQLLQCLAGHMHNVAHVAFAPRETGAPSLGGEGQGPLLLASADVTGSVHLWDVLRGALLAQLTAPAGGGSGSDSGSGGILCLHWLLSRPNHLLVASRAGTLVLWQVSAAGRAATALWQSSLTESPTLLAIDRHVADGGRIAVHTAPSPTLPLPASFSASDALPRRQPGPTPSPGARRPLPTLRPPVRATERCRRVLLAHAPRLRLRRRLLARRGAAAALLTPPPGAGLRAAAARGSRSRPGCGRARTGQLQPEGGRGVACRSCLRTSRPGFLSPRPATAPPCLEGGGRSEGGRVPCRFRSTGPTTPSGSCSCPPACPACSLGSTPTGASPPGSAARTEPPPEGAAAASTFRTVRWRRCSKGPAARCVPSRPHRPHTRRSRAFLPTAAAGSGPSLAPAARLPSSPPLSLRWRQAPAMAATARSAARARLRRARRTRGRWRSSASSPPSRRRSVVSRCSQRRSALSKRSRNRRPRPHPHRRSRLRPAGPRRRPC